jgi:hypothetical protein
MLQPGHPRLDVIYVIYVAYVMFAGAVYRARIYITYIT